MRDTHCIAYVGYPAEVGVVVLYFPKNSFRTVMSVALDSRCPTTFPKGCRYVNIDAELLP